MAVAGVIAIALMLAVSGSTPSQVDPSRLPADQRSWLRAVTEAQKAAEGATEVQVVSLRKERGKAMCRSLGSDLAVSDWIGTVTNVETTLGGDGGVLTVALARDVSVSTWNNGLSDLGDDTIIDPDSPLYEDLGRLKPGDEVVISGNFMAHDGNCVRDMNLLDVDGVTQPEFVFRFTSIKATP
jgi:hypothetical protein